MSSLILDMENIKMRLGPSNMGRCGNGRGVHFGGVTMHPLTVGHPTIVVSVEAKGTQPIKPRETTNEPGGQARKVPSDPTEGKGLACICRNGHSSYEG